MTTGYCTFVYSDTPSTTTTRQPSPPASPPRDEVVVHNPSPPPLTEHEKEFISADCIGATVFSKRFVLGMLLKLYKHDECDLYDNSTTETAAVLPGEETERQLTSKVEQEVCELWDSSTNSDVAKFMFANQGKDVLVNVLSKTACPRLMEICFGVLGNLVCVEELNEELSRDESFRIAMLNYLNVTDALSLVELTRMLTLCISNTTSLPLWMESFKSSHAVAQLIAILNNSLNVRLLEYVIQIIDAVFDTDATLIDKYADAALFQAVNDSYQVIREKKQELVSDLLYILQLVSTTETGVQQLAGDESIFLLIRQCVHDEQNVFAEKRPSLLVSVYSILGCLLCTKPLHIAKLINENVNILEHLITILSDRIQEMATAELNDSSSQKSCSYDREIYVPVYLEVFHDVCNIIGTQQQQQQHDDGELGHNFDNIRECLRSCEVQLHCVFQILGKDDFPEEWKIFLRNLIILNQTHGILPFSVGS